MAILLILLISGRGWEADFVAIYADPDHFTDPRVRLGSRFVASYGDPAHLADLRARLESRFCRYLR